MSFNAISTLEIPQEAIELTLPELKQIYGGWEEHEEEHNRFKLVKKVVTIKKVFKAEEHKEHCEEPYEGYGYGDN